jgi:phage shock protein PspC (stress-responsive transcriptional regulator)
MNGRLYRSRDERVIAGVAGGLADYFLIDPSLVRVLWVLLAVFSGGAFFLIYIVMALVVPEEPWEAYTPAPTMGSAMPPGPDATAGPAEGPVPPVAGAPTMAPPGLVPPPPGGWQSPWQERQAQRAAWRAQRRTEWATRHGGGYDRGGQTAAIVFGLILVVVGVAFLLPLVFPTFAVGRYWPVLLVGLGAVFLIAAIRPSGPPRP